MLSLTGRRVLIVEDDYLVASDLARHLTRAGATVLGPVPTVRGGQRLARLAEAAVLDIHLRDELVFPLADRLDSAGVPFVFYTGCATDALPHRYRSVSLLHKPAHAADCFSSHFGSSHPAEEEDIVKLLPKLRVMARMILFDPLAADRLVERALELAIDHPDRRETGESTADWLMQLLLRAAARHNVALMN